jgi:hypothetical protein
VATVERNSVDVAAAVKALVPRKPSFRSALINRAPLSFAKFADGLARSGGKVSRESLINGIEAIGRSDDGGFQLNLSSRDHVASSFVEKSMLIGDGRVRV